MAATRSRAISLLTRTPSEGRPGFVIGVIVLSMLIDTVSARKAYCINKLCKELFVEKSLCANY